MRRYDIVIIGAGPAGCTLARLLPANTSCAMIAPHPQKPCGGLLSTDAQKSLSSFDITLPKSILVDPQIFSVRTIDVGTKTVRHYGRFYVNMDRRAFDEWLFSMVPDTVDRLYCRATGVRRCGEGFEIDANGETIHTDCVVGADGANSIVRRTLYPKKRIRKHTAVQQWFEAKEAHPFYACVFDKETSDCCSWGVVKDGFMIYGGAFPARNVRERLERQKEKLKDYGFDFGEPIKTEACAVLRPRSGFQCVTGKKCAFLIGEAAGFISPSSFEGISFAFKSAHMLALAIAKKGAKKAAPAYARQALKIRAKIQLKVFKCPFMYNPLLRRLVMKSGISSIKVIS